MRNHRPLHCNLDDAIHMIRTGLATVDEVANAYGIAPSTLLAHLNGVASSRQEHEGLKGSGRQRDDRRHYDSQANCQTSVDYFVFFQVPHWRWRRVSESGDVVSASDQSYESYAECVANAKEHGSEGCPLTLLAQRDRFLP